MSAHDTRLLSLLLLLPILCGGTPSRGLAQVSAALNRCTGPNGDTVYTDRRCDEIGATVRAPRDTPGTGATLSTRGGCARTLQDLQHRITSAIDSHDVNRLGAVYHWVGMDAEHGYQILDRLQAIADRPLIEIVPLLATRAAPSASGDGDSTSASATAAPSASTAIDRPPTPGPPTNTGASVLPQAPLDPAWFPQTSRRQVPVGLRLEQTLGNGRTPLRTVFGLRRHRDCWWITF